MNYPLYLLSSDHIIQLRGIEDLATEDPFLLASPSIPPRVVLTADPQAGVSREAGDGN